MKGILRFIAVISLSVVGAGRVQGEELNVLYLPSIAGDFCGTIWSGGEDVPGLTQFHYTDGSISASYIFIDDGHSYEGTLDRCSLVPGSTLECTWTDAFGTGEFSARFADGLDSFTGYWTPLDGNGSMRFPWTGTRVGSANRSEDCPFYPS